MLRKVAENVRRLYILKHNGNILARTGVEILVSLNYLITWVSTATGSGRAQE